MAIGYTELDFVNGSAPALSAANLNHIDEALKDACDLLDAETVAGRALATAADVAAQHAALGLGDSATKNVGTGAGDVAAGNAPAAAQAAAEATAAGALAGHVAAADPHTQYQKEANLADDVTSIMTDAAEVTAAPAHWIVLVAGAIKRMTHAGFLALVRGAVGWVAQATGFTISGGTTSRTLTVSANADTANIPTAAGKTAADAIGAASGATTAEKLRTLLPEVNEIDDVQLAVAQTIRDVNELERTIQQGQGATIDQDDIGSVALDARATGRANPTVEGRTATNLVVNGDFSDGMIGWTPGGGTVLFDDNILRFTANGAIAYPYIATTKIGMFSNSIFFESMRVRVTNPSCTQIVIRHTGTGANVDYIIQSPIENQWYEIAKIFDLTTLNNPNKLQIMHQYIDNATANGKVMEIDGNYGVSVFNLTSIFGADNEPSEADCAKIFSYFDGTKSIQLPARVRSVSEDESESSTLYIADNEELRSVPAISDEVKVVNGQLVKVQNVQRRTDIHTLTTWGMGEEGANTIRFYRTIPDLIAPLYGGGTITLSIGMVFTPVPSTSLPVDDECFVLSGGRIYIRIAKSRLTTVDTAGFEAWMQAQGSSILDYQLATPIITPLLASGILQAKPKGTVYFEPYYEGSHQTNADGEITLPFTGTVKAVYGYDAQMVEYLLDPSEYALVGTTLTITGALLNEVFYVELSRMEPLAPEMNVNVLNNLVVPTTVNAATYTVLDGDHTLLVAYTPTGTCAITIPSALIANYVRLTIKDSGGSANTNNITISTEGSEKIDGADAYVINTAKGKVVLASDGANLYVVG